MGVAVYVLAVTCVVTCVSSYGNINSEDQAKNFLKDYNQRAAAVFRDFAMKLWQVFVDNTQSNRNQLREQNRIKDSFLREMRNRALVYVPTHMSEDTKRQLSKITNIGIAAQTDDAKYRELEGILIEMAAIVRNAKFCYQPPKTCLNNEPGFFSVSQEYKVLSMLWTSWRNNTGRKIKDMFTKYVALSNEAVQLTGFPDLGAQWRSRYEMPDFREGIKHHYLQIRPLYEQVHAFARSVAKKHQKKMPPTGHIPANMLGNVMADDWTMNSNYFLLYQDPKHGFGLDIQRYNPMAFLQMADHYLVTMGFDRLLQTLMPTLHYYSAEQGRLGEWLAYVFDLLGDGDVRLAFSNANNRAHYFDGLNKLTQIHYFLQYKNKPTVYREPPNDAFLDAVGGAIEMSVQDLNYLKRKNFTTSKAISEKQIINYQMQLALRNVVRIPFAYVVDEWRWSVFNGSTTPADYNKVWWRLRCELQGVSPPVKRAAEDFDAGGLYQIAANQPYIKHFLSSILKFQILKALCNTVGYRGPLHKCNLENKAAAGDKLRAVMKLGSSVHWTVALRELTGQDVIDSRPMLEYFKPLMTHIKRKKVPNVGWQPQCGKKPKVSRK